MKTPCRLLFLCICAIVCHFALTSATGQVRITSLTLSTRKVLVTNFGEESVDLSNWWWCHQFFYTTLGGSLAAGETREFTLPNALSQTASDLGLYDSASFASTDSMQDFLQWGSGGNGREFTASSKGIWTEGAFLAVPPNGKSLHSKGLTTTGVRDTNWFPGWPTTTFPLPDISIESIAVTGGSWRIIARSPYLTASHRVDVSGDLSQWQPVAVPVINELGGGRIDITFPATGTRQFTRLRAVP